MDRRDGKVRKVWERWSKVGHDSALLVDLTLFLFRSEHVPHFPHWHPFFHGNSTETKLGDVHYVFCTPSTRFAHSSLCPACHLHHWIFRELLNSALDTEDKPWFLRLNSDPGVRLQGNGTRICKGVCYRVLIEEWSDLILRILSWGLVHGRGGHDSQEWCDLPIVPLPPGARSAVGASCPCFHHSRCTSGAWSLAHCPLQGRVGPGGPFSMRLSRPVVKPAQLSHPWAWVACSGFNHTWSILVHVSCVGYVSAPLWRGLTAGIRHPWMTCVIQPHWASCALGSHPYPPSSSFLGPAMTRQKKRSGVFLLYPPMTLTPKPMALARLPYPLLLFTQTLKYYLLPLPLRHHGGFL